MQKNIEHEAALKASLKNLNTIYFKKDDANNTGYKRISSSRSENLQHRKKDRTIKILEHYCSCSSNNRYNCFKRCLLFHNTKKNNTAVINTSKTDTAYTL